MTLEEEWEIDRPRREEIAGCMRDRGHDYDSSPVEPGGLARLSREDPTAFAESYGYGFYALEVNRVSSDVAPPVSGDGVSEE